MTDEERVPQEKAKSKFNPLNAVSRPHRPSRVEKTQHASLLCIAGGAGESPLVQCRVCSCEGNCLVTRWPRFLLCCFVNTDFEMMAWRVTGNSVPFLITVVVVVVIPVSLHLDPWVVWTDFGREGGRWIWGEDMQNESYFPRRLCGLSTYINIVETPPVSLFCTKPHLPSPSFPLIYTHTPPYLLLRHLRRHTYALIITL